MTLPELPSSVWKVHAIKFELSCFRNFSIFPCNMNTLLFIALTWCWCICYALTVFWIVLLLFLQHLRQTSDCPYIQHAGAQFCARCHCFLQICKNSCHVLDHRKGHWQHKTVYNTKHNCTEPTAAQDLTGARGRRLECVLSHDLCCDDSRNSQIQGFCLSMLVWRPMPSLVSSSEIKASLLDQTTWFWAWGNVWHAE